MAKTRKTTKVAKKQKPSATSPLEILLEFKRNPSDEETTVEGLAVAAENDNIPKEFVDEKVDQIIVDEEAVFVGIDDAAIAEIPVAEAMPVTTMETTKTDEKEMEIDIKTLSTSTQTDPQSIPEVLLSTSQSSYQTLLQKYNLLKSTCTSSSLDTYKSLHQGRMKELERTIEILSGQTPDGISLKAFEEMQEQIKSLQEKNVDLERMANLHLSNQLEVVKVKEVLEKKVEEISNQLNGVLEDRSRVVLELGEVTSLLSKESLKVKKAEEEFMKLRMEKCDLEAKLGQSDALLAKINVKNGNVNGDELQEKIDEEVLYSQKLESICELAESMTGITVQNLEIRQRRPLESSVDKEFSCFMIKQRGSVHSITFEICVPVDDGIKVAYVPTTKLKAIDGLPDFLEDEIEFEKDMLQEFFGNLKKFVDGEINNDDGEMVD